MKRLLFLSVLLISCAKDGETGPPGAASPPASCTVSTETDHAIIACDDMTVIFWCEIHGNSEHCYAERFSP